MERTIGFIGLGHMGGPMAENMQAQFTVDLVLKDLELARQLCQDCGIPNFTLNTGIQFYRAAQLSGRGGKESSSVIEMIRNSGSSAEQ